MTGEPEPVPSAAVSIPVERPPSSPAEPPLGPPDEVRPARSWWIRALLAGLAVSFLAGAVGYLIGTRETATPSNAVDVGFLQDMSDHHDQAVGMALTAFRRSEDPVVRGFAQDVLVFQRYELGLMAAYLEDHGAVRPEYDPQRPTMEWMDMSLPLEHMTGMASADDLAALDQATGRELDRRFLELMAAHHEGGAHMSTYAAEHAADPRVRALADRMARYQSTEVNEYRQYLARLDDASS